MDFDMDDNEQQLAEELAKAMPDYQQRTEGPPRKAPRCDGASRNPERVIMDAADRALSTETVSARVVMKFFGKDSTLFQPNELESIIEESCPVSNDKGGPSPGDDMSGDAPEERILQGREGFLDLILRLSKEEDGDAIDNDKLTRLLEYIKAVDVDTTSQTATGDITVDGELK